MDKVDWSSHGSRLRSLDAVRGSHVFETLQRWCMDWDLDDLVGTLWLLGMLVDWINSIRRANARCISTFFLTFNFSNFWLLVIWSNFWQIWRSSFSAVSTPIFASKYSFESSWRNLQDLHAFCTAQHSKCQLTSVKLLRIFSILFWKFHWFFQKVV